MNYDVIIFQTLNGWVGKIKFLDVLGVFVASYLPYLVVIFLLFLFWQQKNKRTQNLKMLILAATSALLSRWVVKVLIVWFYERPRPFIFLENINSLVTMIRWEHWQSFPSGHTLMLFAISTAVFIYNRRLGVYLFITSLIIGLARVFVGVHWPTDILFGAILGILTTLGVYGVFRKYFKA